MQKLEKIIDGLGAYICDDLCYYRETSMDKNDEGMEAICSECKVGEYLEAIRKHMNDGWIPVEERLPEDERANYEVTFINECGYEEHGFAQWYDGEFHIPAVVIAWREHLEPYRPEPLETRKELERRENERD